MATKISIRGLRVYAHHGVFQFERDLGQDFFIDCDVWVDAEAAAANDDLAQTVNYGALADALVADAKQNPVDLLETLAERLLAEHPALADRVISRWIGSAVRYAAA